MADSIRLFGRRRRWRWLPSRWVVVATVAVLTLAALGWVVLFSTLLLGQRVFVDGATRLTPAAITRAAQVPAGVPLSRIDLDAIAARVAADPSVASVSVTRRWPHTVAITVVERRPVALLETNDGIRGIDATGAVFPLGPHEGHRLPHLVAAPGTAPRAIIEGAKVAARLPTAVRRRLDQLHVASRDAITLLLRSGDHVVWGSAEQSGRKARVLVALLHHPAAVYDVSVPELATTSG